MPEKPETRMPEIQMPETLRQKGASTTGQRGHPPFWFPWPRQALDDRPQGRRQIPIVKLEARLLGPIGQHTLTFQHHLSRFPQQ